MRALPNRAPVGMTMMEVMVAVGILGVSILALISVLIFSFKAQVKSEKTHCASLIAKTLLNQSGHLLEEDFDRVSLSPPLPGPGKKVLPSQPDYQVEVTLVSESPNLRRVEVSVSWEDYNGHQEQTTASKFLRGAK